MNTATIGTSNIRIRVNFVVFGKVVVSVEIVNEFDLRQGATWTVDYWINGLLKLLVAFSDFQKAWVSSRYRIKARLGELTGQFKP